MSYGKGWLTVLVLVLTASLCQEPAEAQVFFHRHFHPRSHFHFRTYYPVRAYYPIRNYCPPAVVWGPSVTWAPRCWPVYYPRIVFNPVFCAPAFYDPVCYYPNVYAPIGYYGVAHHTTLSQPVIPAWSARPTSVQRIVQTRTVSNANATKARTAPALTTYSPVWTQSAVGLIDDMMERGDWEVAQRSLQRMDSIATPLGHAVLLRRAVFDLVAHADSIDSSQLDRLLDRFNQAAAAGSRFESDELRGKSLGSYLRAASIDLNPILDRLAQRALETPERSGREMLLLSVLLKLDHQPERASLFADASGSFAEKSIAFRWHAALQSVSPKIDPDTLLAAKD